MGEALSDVRNTLLLLEILVTLLVPAVMTINIGVGNIYPSNRFYSFSQNLVIGVVSVIVIMLLIQLIVVFVGINQSNMKNTAYRICIDTQKSFFTS